jgi:hypothetical protein
VWKKAIAKKKSISVLVSTDFQALVGISSMVCI